MRKPTQVIERLGHSTNDKGYIEYQERLMSWEDAETLHGSRLDRRRNYCVIEGLVCISDSYTSTCTGCYETEDGHPVGRYPRDKKTGIPLGSGCQECGYQGKVRQSYWFPLNGPKFD